MLPDKKDSITPTDAVIGKWFKGIYKHPTQGEMKTPRVQYLGLKNNTHHFMKEDGKIISVSEKEIKDQKYLFVMDSNQKFKLTSFKKPDYSKDSHLDRFNPKNHPFLKKELILEIKQDSDWFHGSHIKIQILDKSKKDHSSLVAHFQTVASSIEDLGDKATDLAGTLWRQNGIKVKLGEKLKRLVDTSISV